MSSLQAERDGWQRSVQGSSANGVPQRHVFPEFIYVNVEDFKRAADPFWEPNRPTTSKLYKAHVNTQGRIFCTRRMQTWLHGLPDRPEAHSEPISPGTPFTLGLPDSIRPRAQSAPAPEPPGPPPAAGLGTDLSVPRFRFGHPNPLSQHPVHIERRHSHFQKPPSRLSTPPQLEQVSSQPRDQPQLEVVHSQLEFHPQLEQSPPWLVEGPSRPQEVPLHFEDLYFQPKIPQRRSSLYFNSQPASQAPQSHRPPSQFEDLFQGFAQHQASAEHTSESEQSEDPGEASENEGTPSHLKFENNMGILTRTATKRHTIHFGSKMGEMEGHLPADNGEKDGRAQVSPKPFTPVETFRRDPANLTTPRAISRASLLLLMKSLRSPREASSVPFGTAVQPWESLRETSTLVGRVLPQSC